MSRFAFALALLSVPAMVMADDWSSFRGGSKAGVAAKALPETWDAKTNVAWQLEIPGRGWSSPVVVGDRVFVTSVTCDEKVPDSRKGLYIQDLLGKPQPGEHTWLVHCLDLKSGKSLWKSEAAKGKAPEGIHIKNSYASETPVADGEHVWAVFGNLGVWCFTRDGKEVWSQKFDGRKTQMNWGPAASPVLHKGVLYVARDGEDKSELLALDAKTGKENWKVAREEKSNWATPFVWENDQRTEIVVPGKNRVRSYGLDGKQLWELGGMSSLVIPTPSAAHGLLYVSSGYVGDARRRPVFAVRPGASGDITLDDKETSNKSIAWCQKLAGPYHPSPVVLGDYLYVLLDRGYLSCYAARTGAAVYEKKQLDKTASAFTASPWAADGKIYCLSEDGETVVVQAGKEFKVLGKNVLDGDMALATPALTDGGILLRTQSKLYRIGSGK